MKSLQGQFLIASPHLADTNFYKGVVLMIKHDDEGAMGLILNRPTENTVTEVWKMVGEEDIECPQPIFFGGPVSGPLVADRKSTRLNSSHGYISYAVFCLKKKNYAYDKISSSPCPGFAAPRRSSPRAYSRSRSTSGSTITSSRSPTLSSFVHSVYSAFAQ